MTIRKFKHVRCILRASNFEHRVLNSNSCSTARNAEVEMQGFSRQKTIEAKFCFHILVWHDLCHLGHSCIVGHGPPHNVNRGGQRQLWSPRCLRFKPPKNDNTNFIGDYFLKRLGLRCFALGYPTNNCLDSRRMENSFAARCAMQRAVFRWLVLKSMSRHDHTQRTRLNTDHSG
jgi:hypothetical protein